MRILAIETSCDETGIALLTATGGLGKTGAIPKIQVLKNLVASQIAIHRPFGGVVPNLAKREHLKNLPILLDKIAGKTPAAKEKFFAGEGVKRDGRGADAGGRGGIDLITVTVGPGLEPALWTGIEFAKDIASRYRKPLIGANHLEGHLYSFLLSPEFAGSKSKTAASTKLFPAIALIVSGGHTILLRVDSLSKWKRLGETRDDAAGEAFDKVARLLELPYPGGPEIEKLAAAQAKAAKQNNRPGEAHGTIAFPRPMLHDKSYDFSFSGLKTAVLYYHRDHPAKGAAAIAKQKMDIAASFQAAALDVLAAKTVRAAREVGGKSVAAAGARSIILCGGVAANKALRARLAREARDIGCAFLVPEFKYNLDNAAMIGAAGYFAYLRKKKYPFRANGGMEI
jgi:N6-L-threonylcarbamoyladenine synthase